MDSIYENEHLHKWPECQADAGKMPGWEPHRGESLTTADAAESTHDREEDITHLWEPWPAQGRGLETWPAPA